MQIIYKLLMSDSPTVTIATMVFIIIMYRVTFTGILEILVGFSEIVDSFRARRTPVILPDDLLHRKPEAEDEKIFKNNS